MHVTIRTIVSKHPMILLISMLILGFTTIKFPFSSTYQKFCRWHEQLTWKQSQTSRYKKALELAAQNGCGEKEANHHRYKRYNRCLGSDVADLEDGYPQFLKEKLLESMETENISFQKLGLTLVDIDALVARGRIMVLDQLLLDVRSRKDSLLPPDIFKIRTLCHEVFVAQTELPSKPTARELQAMERATHGRLKHCISPQ